MAGTKSYGVTFHDQDAPTGCGHDIAAQVNTLAGGVNGGTLATGAIEGNTDPGKPGFLSPCPPVGRTHNHVHTVHALKVQAAHRQGVSPALVGFFI